MVDIPSTTAAPPPPSATAPTTTVTPVETTVSDVPDKIQQLIRQIQVNATIADIPGDGTITLNSAIGSLTLLLPTIVDAKQQQITQQLINLLQSQKPVTLVVQPGTPPTQAFLLVPNPPSSAAAPNAQTISNIVQTNTLLQTIATPPPPPVSTGTTFTAVVLPQNIALPSPASPQLPPIFSQPYTQTGAQPSAPAGTVPLQSSPPQQTPAPLPSSPAPSLFPATNFVPEILNILEEAAFVAATKAEQAVTQTQQQVLNSIPNAPLPAAPAIPATPTTVPPANVPPLQPLLSSSTNPQPVPTLATLLQPGTEVSLRVDAIYFPPPSATPPSGPQNALPMPLPNLPSLPALPAPGPNQIVATVVGTGTNGQLILKADDATLYVKQSADVPVGSSLLLTVEPKTPSLPVTLPDTQNFASLQQAVATLTQVDPQLARMVIENHIPQPTAALPGALLFLMSAFKQGSVRTWLGDDAVNALNRAGKFELVGKLTEELNNAGQPARDAVVGEWKAYPLPLQNNNQFQAINLYVHEHGQKQTGAHETGKPAKNNVRFLIDVRMSRLGNLQLDGFVQSRKLDMIIRSERTLPEGLHQDLRNAYTKALGAVDYAGSLNFQVGRHHWLILQKSAIPSTITT